MLVIFVRAIVLYSLLMVAMRVLGKRQLGQFQPYEFVMVMLVANLLSAPISDVGTPLLHGVMPILALFVVSAVIKLLCMRSDRLRAIVSGRPSVIITKGIIQQKELKKLALSLSDVLEGIREAGILDPAEVGTAIMEADGSITAFPHSKCRPPTTSEMGILTGYEGTPMVLVMDGRVQENNLCTAALTKEWLNSKLMTQGLVAQNVFLASVDTRGRMSVQDRGGNLCQFQVINPQEVKW